MRSRLLSWVLGLACLAVSGSVVAQGLPGGVIPRVPLRRHGLERAWVTQADMAAGRSKIADIQLHRNLLLVHTDVGLYQAIDAETGRTLWRSQVGDRGLVNVPPGIGDDFIAAASGANLYVLSRADGRVRFETPLEDAPMAGLAVGNNRAYVPTVKGRVESYIVSVVKEAKTVPAEPRTGQIFFGVSGMPQTACLLTPNAIVVGTDSGNVFGFAPGYVGPRYSVESYGEVRGTPAYHDGKIIFGSRDQYVYAVRETEGDMVWRTSLDEPVDQSPVVIGNVVYVVTELGGLYQLGVEDGSEKWFVPGIKQFVSAGAGRIYASDGRGRLQVLDASTGRLLDSIPTEAYPVKFTNTQNDRIYLSSETGVLHCLRETALAEPIVYRTNDPPKPAETQQKPLDAAAPTNPAKAPAADADPAEKPADDAEAPADDAADDAAKEPAEDLGDFGE